jgi:hypothetical protein
MTWLGRVRQQEQRVHLPVGSAQDLGESPLWPTLAVLTAAGLYATLPGRFIVGSGAGAFGALRWIVPALTIVLIVPLALTVPRSQGFLRAAEAQVARVKLSRRVASSAVIALITAANGVSIILLVHLLVNGAHTQANLLLKAGIHLWITNVLVFALWFWQLDGGGPSPAGYDPPTRRTSSSRSSCWTSRSSAGSQRSSTTSTSRSRTPRRSARRTRCR